jgi:hypothetical protein
VPNNVNKRSVFHGYSSLFVMFISNENALIGIVIASNNVDGSDSFYSYEGWGEFLTIAKFQSCVGHHDELSRYVTLL